MISMPRSGLIALASLALFDSAQSMAGEGPKKSAPQQVESVTVTAERPAVLNLVDRKVYDLSADVQSNSGSAGDVLKNLPSVDVGVTGEVTLRGDPNIEILIDGRPSTLMNQSNRGTALQQMDASLIERIEVITTPSAQYGSEGSGGIINIITKKNRAAGFNGSGQASFGSEGRYNLGVNLNYRDGPLTLRNNLTARQDVRKRITNDERINFDGGSGPVTSSLQNLVTNTIRLSVADTLGADIDLDDSRQITTSLTYNDRAGRPGSNEIDRSYADHVTRNITARSGQSRERQINTSGMMKFTQALPSDGEKIEIDWHRDEASETQYLRFHNFYSLPNLAPTYDDQLILADEVTNQFNAKYIRGGSPIGAVTLGYAVEWESDDYINFGNFVDPLTGGLTANPLLTSHFRYGHVIHSAYGLDDFKIGAWSLQAGLRIENAAVDTNQVTSAQKAQSSYLKVHPSLNAEYELSEQDSLRLGYSHRLVRPRHEDLDPYPFYQDAFNVKAGNPFLLPEETHSLEAGFSRRDGGKSLQATVYFRAKTNVLSQVSKIIDSNVLLTTKENLGSSTTAGLEAILRQPISKDLLLNASSNFYYTEIDASNLTVAARRSTLSASGKLGADIQILSDTTLQISTIYTGKRLLPQGYRPPMFGANFGLRTKIEPNLIATLTLSDILNSQREKTIITTASIYDHNTRRQLGQVAYFGLNWTFGPAAAKRDRAESFDYNEPQ
jgi:outer membrane receptor protein involved in Fe transport